MPQPSSVDDISTKSGFGRNMVKIKDFLMLLAVGNNMEESCKMTLVQKANFRKLCLEGNTFHSTYSMRLAKKIPESAEPNTNTRDMEFG
jgi:hypothetical protein